MSNPEPRASSRLDVPQLVLGLSLVVLGILFILRQADILSIGQIISSGWPVVITVYGVVLYVATRRLVASLIIVALGAVLLLFSLDIVPGSAFSLIGPLLLIGLGIWIIMARQRVAGKEAADTVSSVSIFGELEVIRQSQAFAGGTITAIFSSTTVDLRSATLAAEGARIDILTAFAEVIILVPPGWRVVESGTPIFAGYNDQTGSHLEDAPTLTISLLAIFAEVSVRNE